MRRNMVAAAGEMVRSREEAGEISKARYRLAGIRPAERRYPMVVQATEKGIIKMELASETPGTSGRK